MSDPLNICFVLGAGFSCAYSENAPGMPEFLDFALARAYCRPSAEHKILGDIATKYFNSPTKKNVEDWRHSLRSTFRAMLRPLANFVAWLTTSCSTSSSIRLLAQILREIREQKARFVDSLSTSLINKFLL